MLAVSNDVAGIKKILDLIKQNEQTKFLQQLNPPIDPASNNYGLLIIKSEVVTNILQPYLGAFGVIPPDAFSAVSSIREIRSVRVKNGNWLQQNLIVQLQATSPTPDSAPQPGNKE